MTSFSIAFEPNFERYDRLAGAVLGITKCIFRDLMLKSRALKAKSRGGDPQVAGEIAESLKTRKLGLRM